MIVETADRKKILAEFLRDVWSNGDVDACDRHIADRYTIHHDPGDRWDRRELNIAEYKERLCLSRAPFPDQRFDVREMFADGDAVVATWLWSATHTGDFPEFPATGKTIRMSGMTVYYFDERNRLCGHWQVVDRLTVFQQLRQA